jgi:hypothetical protein
MPFNITIDHQPTNLSEDENSGDHSDGTSLATYPELTQDDSTSKKASLDSQSSRQWTSSFPEIRGPWRNSTSRIRERTNTTFDFGDLSGNRTTNNPSGASDDVRTPRSARQTGSRDRHSTSNDWSRYYTRSRSQTTNVPNSYPHALPSPIPPRQAPLQNPYYIPSSGYQSVPQGYPHPQPVYQPTGNPYYYPYQPYDVLQNPVHHLGNLTKIGNGLNIINIRNINGEVPNRDPKEVQLRFAKTLSIFKQYNDAGPTRDSHQIRQARCISGPEEGDHDIVVLTTEGAMNAQGEPASDSRWTYVDAVPYYILKQEMCSFSNPKTHSR